jgi:hypothetical protein
MSIRMSLESTLPRQFNVRNRLVSKYCCGENGVSLSRDLSAVQANEIRSRLDQETDIDKIVNCPSSPSFLPLDLINTKSFDQASTLIQLKVFEYDEPVGTSRRPKPNLLSVYPLPLCDRCR